MVKDNLKLKAQDLRRQGKTYSEILKNISVAKSTLSLWLREVGLSKMQKQRITEKRRLAQRKGADAQRNKRIKKQEFLIQKAQSEIGRISKRELWLIGIALYWAEGSKEKKERAGTRVQFSNSDPFMIQLFLRWITFCVSIPINRISCDIYIHDSHKDNVSNVIIFWSKITGFPKDHFSRVYYKRNKIKTNRRNTGNLYNGLLRVNITASSDFNRIITGWTMGIIKNCGIV